MDTLLFALNQYLELIAYVFLGYLLRRFGVFKEADGETALRFARFVTVPALIVCTLGEVTLQGWMLIFPIAAVVYAAISALFAFLLHRTRPRRERAQLLGASVGAGLNMLGYPFIEATFGPSGLLVAILFDVPNMIIKHVGSYFLYATAGPVFPNNYVHDDQGVYQGEWRGTNKEGLGVYTYPSGAKYEGEWRDNVKQGRGIYYFPKGGIYEGEWSDGNPDGIGVRTFTSGQVKAGRWAGGKLVEPLELWQCTNAVQGAAEAAEAAKRLEIGAGSIKEALSNLVRDMPFVVTLVVIGLNVFMLELPMAVEAAALSLSAANKCLIMLAVGIMFKNPAQPRQYPDLLKVMIARYIPALAMGVFLPFANSAFHFNEFPAVAFTLVALLAMLSPVPIDSVHLARRFRLGVTFAEALYHSSALASMALITAVGLASYIAAAAGVYEVVNVLCTGMSIGLIVGTALVTKWTQSKVPMKLEVPAGGPSAPSAPTGATAEAADAANKPATGTAALPKGALAAPRTLRPAQGGLDVGRLERGSMTGRSVVRQTAPLGFPTGAWRRVGRGGMAAFAGQGIRRPGGVGSSVLI